MSKIRNGLYDVIISFFNETDESLTTLEILLSKLCSTEDELNSCLNQVYNYKHNQKCTILMIAVLESRINLAKMLLRKFRKSINLETKGAITYYSMLMDGVTALWTAASRKNIEFIKLLVENGAEVDTASKFNATPLHIACTSGRFDIVKYLVEEAKADVLKVNNGSLTCLNLAEISNNLELIEYVLRQPGINVNHQNNNGNTTLHWAVKYNKVKHVKLLLKFQARVDIKNSKNMTGLTMAAENVHEEIVESMLGVENLIDVKERIEALELLGASFACISKTKTYNLGKAFQYLMQAMKLRESSGNLKTSLTTLLQPIAAYNYRTECVSIAELELIRYDFESFGTEALLIRERLLLSTSCIGLIGCIWDAGWMYAQEQMYDRCIYLWFHGLELSSAVDNVSMHGLDPNDRVLYISIGVRDFGELYCNMLSAEWKDIPTTMFLEILKFAINQFRRLCQPSIETEKIVGIHEHNHFVRSILYFIYVSTKLSFKENEEQQLHKLIKWINRLNIRTKVVNSTLLHICCNSKTSIDCELEQNNPSFPCASTIQLLINCDFYVNSFNKNGNTPLHVLVRTISDSKLSVVNTVLDIFLATNQLHMDYINTAGETPLERTANTDLRKLLIRKTNLSLKCLCAKRLNQLNVNYDECLSQNLTDFVKRHGE